MAEWKKVLLAGDAAELEVTTPASAVGTTATTGSGATASRYDHVHDIGTGAIDASNLFVAGVVDNAAMADDAIKAAEIDDTANDIAFSQLILTPKTAGVGTTEGTMFYDSDDNHVYVYVV